MHLESNEIQYNNFLFRWLADSSCLSNQLHREDDDILIDHEHTGGTYKLRDSRYLSLIY